MGLYAYRLLGAAVLDAGMYEGIENDKRTTTQAALTVVLASIAAGIGAGGLPVREPPAAAGPVQAKLCSSRG